MAQNRFSLLAKNALNILNINFSEFDELQTLLKKLETAIILPSTATEGEISRLAYEIAQEIRNSGDSGHISDLLEQLRSEFIFSSLD